MKTFFKSIAFAVAAIAVGTGAASAYTWIGVPVDANQYMFDQINAFRVANGAPKLKSAFGVGYTADHYAIWLAVNNKNGHFDDGLSPMGRMAARATEFKSSSQKKLFAYCSLYENIAEQWSEPNQLTWKEAIDKAMDFWRNSPGHRANMLSNSNVMGTGIAATKVGGRWYYKEVMMFADRTCLQ